MKIGIDARLWDETGVGRYIRNLVRELQEIDKINSYVLFVKNTKKVTDFITNNNWQVVQTDISWHTFAEQLQMPRFLAKYDLDLVHFPYFSIPIMYSKPYVVTIHDLIIDHFDTGKASTQPLPIYKIKRFLYTQVLKSAVSHAKAVLVPSTATLDEVIDHYNVPKRKLFVIHEGYEKITSEKKSEFTNTYFLYVGNAYPHKNLELLIDAFQSYKHHNKNDTKLYIVGRKDYFYNTIEHLIESLQLKRDIKILHTVDDGQLTRLYQNAKALFAPSRMEGFGLTPLEALNNRCLTAVSDIPVFHEICDEAALYFDPTSVEAIQKTMEKIDSMSNVQKKEYIQKGVERANKFSWRTMAQQTLEIYENSPSLRSG